LALVAVAVGLALAGLRRVALDPHQEHTLEHLLVGRDVFAHARRLHGARLVAKGSTHFHLFVIPVCSAVLYLEPHVANAAVMSNVPKALEIAYARHVKAADFRLSTATLIERNGLMTPRVAALVAQFNALYRDVRPGDRYTLEYHPRHAVSIRLNGAALGHVGARDAQFATALFSVWFGRAAFHATFRDDLLRPVEPVRPESACAETRSWPWWRRRRRGRGREPQVAPMPGRILESTSGPRHSAPRTPRAADYHG